MPRDFLSPWFWIPAFAGMTAFWAARAGEGNPPFLHRNDLQGSHTGLLKKSTEGAHRISLPP